MMKNRLSIRLITALMLALAMMFVGTVSSYAADGDTDVSSTDTVTYNVKVYSGLQGTIDGDTDTVRDKDYAAGESVSFSVDDITVNNEKYYCKGFRISGHDADEGSSEPSAYTNPTFNASCDVSYTAVYGIKGAMVKYTVQYIDADTGTVMDSDEYYGMPGDKPVVSYKYFENYMPNVYSQADYLSDNEADNVFKFLYERATSTTTVEPGGTTVINRTVAGAGAAAPGTAGNPAGAAAIAPNAVPGAAPDTTTIGDNETPLQYQDLDENETPLAGVNKGVLIGGIAAAVLLIAAIAAFLARRRHVDEEE